jgi:ubiquinone biosynthesis protein UbiJ
MLGNTRTMLTDNTHATYNLLDRIERLEDFVEKLKQKIDKLESSDYNLDNYTLGK